MKLFEEVNWGIIGCGNVTEIKSGPAFNLVKHSRLRAVMRRDAAKAKDYAERHQVEKWYSNATDLINDVAINAVYVATPPGSHAYYAIESLKAGKAVYVEKPMGRTYAECIQMLKTSEETGTPLYVAYYRRSLPYYHKIKQLLDSGVIGGIQNVELKLFQPPKNADFENEKLPWRVKPEISGGGYFFDLASHQIDMLNFLFGDVVKTIGYAENRAGLYKAEDFVKAELEFASGLKAIGEWNFAVHTDESSDKTIIEGTKGKLIFSFFNGQPIRLQKGIYHKNWHIQSPINIQLPHIQNVVNELIGEGKCPADNLAAAKTNKLMEEIVKDYYTIRRA